MGNGHHCAHQACGCMVEENLEYCGDLCKERATGPGEGEQLDRCGCAHGPCERAAPLAFASAPRRARVGLAAHGDG